MKAGAVGKRHVESAPHFEAEELGGSHADDLERLPVEDDASADGFVVAAELALPHPVASLITAGPVPHPL